MNAKGKSTLGKFKKYLNLKGYSENSINIYCHYVLEFISSFDKPYMYLFNGQNSLKYTAGSCNKIVKKYLGAKYHFHMLRHSSFTSMLESGTDISIIQKIAGHKKTDTTRIYAQVSTELLHKAYLPI